MTNNLIYSKFDIESLFSDSIEGIDFPSTIRYAVIGNDADDRCRMAHAFLAQHYSIIQISYDADKFMLSRLMIFLLLSRALPSVTLRF